MINFNKVVLQHMSDKGINKTKLAQEMGYSVQYISALLSGKKRWNEETINKACDVLGLTAIYKPKDRGQEK